MSFVEPEPAQAGQVYALLAEPLLDMGHGDTAAIVRAATAMHARLHDLSTPERKSFVLFWLHLVELDFLHRHERTLVGEDPVLVAGDHRTTSVWAFLLHQAAQLALETREYFEDSVVLGNEPVPMANATLDDLRDTLWLLHLCNTQAKRHATLWTFRSTETQELRRRFVHHYYEVRAAAAFVYAEAAYRDAWLPRATVDLLSGTKKRLLECLRLLEQLERAESATLHTHRLKQAVLVRLLVVEVRLSPSTAQARELAAALEETHQWLPSADTRRAWGWPAQAEVEVPLRPVMWDTASAADVFVKGRNGDEHAALRAWPFKLRPEVERETALLVGGERDGTRLLLDALRKKH